MKYSIVRATWTIGKLVLGRRLLRRYQVQAQFHDPIPTGAFLLLANHSHALDGYVLGALLPRPVRYMANIEGVSRIAAMASGFAGAFGKRKGMPDVSALRAAIGYLRAGEPVGIFPEGDRSWDGVTAPIGAGIGRLARMAGVPLVLARQRGSYLTRPRWADADRRGSWHIDFWTIPAGEVAGMGDESLASRIREALDNDDIAWAAGSGVRFESDAPARGISRAIWACPVCGSAGTMSESDTSLACSSCNSNWAIDAMCSTIPRTAGDPADVRAWTAWQRQHSVERMRAPEPVAVPVEGLADLGAGGRRFGPGTIEFSAGGMTFLPGNSGVPIRFDASRVEGFVDNFNVYCAFNYCGRRWRIDPGRVPPLMLIDFAGAARSAGLQNSQIAV